MAVVSLVLPAELADWAAAELAAPALVPCVVWRSDDRVVTRLDEAGGDRPDASLPVAYLKVGAGLADERDRLVWLDGRLGAPRLLGYRDGEVLDALLTAPAAGTDLTRPEWKARPETLVRLLADALRGVHALDTADCPFRDESDRPTVGPTVVVHGDACLPNVLAEGDSVTGVLDVGELRVASPEVDLAAACWSLDYNLGPGWGGAFLAAYGWPEHDDETVERLRLRY